MNEWLDRVRDHRIWGELQELGPIIDEAAGHADITPASSQALERLRAALTFCGKKLGSSNPLVVTPALLDAIVGHLDAQAAEVKAFISDQNYTHLVNANNSADLVLANAVLVPSSDTSENLIDLVRDVTDYRLRLDAEKASYFESRQSNLADIEGIRADFTSLKGQVQGGLTELRAQIDSEKQKISTQASEQQKQFADAQEARGVTYNDTLRKVQENLNKTLTDQQGQFSTAQESRNVQFTAAQNDAQKRVADLITDYTKRLGDQDADFTKQRDAFVADSSEKLELIHSDYVKQVDGILGIVNKRLKEVETLVGVIGNLGVTSGYQTTANNARISMWIWQGGAVLAMVGVIGFAYHAFLPAISGEFKWGGFVARVFLTITVGVLAAYAAQQGDRFYQMEKYNRRIALELAAIDPFIALLPQDEQYKFKLEIGRRSFGQENTVPSEKSDKSPATALDVIAGTKEGQQLLQLLIELAQKLPKVG